MDNSYQDVTDHGTWVKFKVTGEENRFFLSWTTTPWTLVGNVALVVDEKADYALVEQNKEQYYVAKDLVEKVLGEKTKIVEKMKGKELLGMEYEPLYTYMPTEGKKAYYILSGDFVSLEDGTGIVHTAAVYGEDDYRLATEHDLPRVGTLDDAGKFTENVALFKGMFFKDAEQPIIDDLEKRGLLLKDEEYSHSYPFCWRCSTPLYYNAVPAWFINVQKIKAKMLKHNEKINWYPEHLKYGRFGKGLETAPDWNISRNRYWGSPMPVWKCEECDAIEVLGSLDELADKAGVKKDSLKDIHLPAIDKYDWDCDSCKGKMKRVSQVFDCWVESGSMPFASVHYPFENKEKFEANFPGEFIAEYIAQTRGWFYTLHVLSTAIFDKPSFVNAVTTGNLLAADGKKISKSKKNYTDPLELFDLYGADAFRFYLMASPVMQAENLNFDDNGVKEVFRKVMMLVNNIYSFYAMYAETGHVQPTEKEISKLKLTELDHWLLARWDEVHKEVTELLDEYNVVKPGRLLIEFINDFSTWYLRRSRDRFKGEDHDDKHVALSVTRYVLENLIKVLAPYTPFITEHLYQELNPGKKDSVHLQDWPEVSKKKPNEKVLETMAVVRSIVEAALAARADAGIRIRQVCETLQMTLPDSIKKLAKGYEQLIKDEVNVKNVEVVAKIKAQKGYAVKEARDLSVALMTELSEELLQEGLSRELIRQINSLRKNTGLSIDSRVNVHYQTDSDFVEAVLEKFGPEIQKQTLSDAILPQTPKGETSKLKFHEHEVNVGIEIT